MKLKFGTSSLLLTRSEESFKIILALGKLRDLTRMIFLVIAFTSITILASAGYLWLSLGIFLTLITVLLIEFILHGLNYTMDFDLDPGLSKDIMEDVLVEGR